MFLLTFIYHHTSDTHPHLPLHSHLHRVIRKKPRYQFHIICLLCKHGKRAYLTTIFPLFFVCMVEQKSKLPVLFGRRKKDHTLMVVTIIGDEGTRITLVQG
ncbi:hypothetical protein AAZX31_18G112000 [Glycine max]